MPRILCIDYGIRRCGLAVTDPLQIIVNGLDTVETPKLFLFLEQYLGHEKVEKMVFGFPTHTDGTETYLVDHIKKFIEKCKLKWPDVVVDFQDEQFSSHMAKQVIFQSGVGKKKRQDKALVDKISAVIILQKYLKHIH